VLIYYFAMQMVSLDQIATGYPLVNAFLRLLLWETVAPILQQWVEGLAVFFDWVQPLVAWWMNLFNLVYYHCL
jgi:hypothetical protein